MVLVPHNPLKNHILPPGVIYPQFGNHCHICTTFHYHTNNILQNTTPHCCLGSLAFLLWKFDRLVWSQIFCLTFSENCRKFGAICNLPNIPEFKQFNVSMSTLRNTLPSLTQFNIPNIEMQVYGKGKDLMVQEIKESFPKIILTFSSDSKANWKQLK